MTEKRPEVKYWRIGDSFLDQFTYYSETGIANLHTDITNYTPIQLSLAPGFLGPPASVIAATSLTKTFQAGISGARLDGG